MSNQRDAWAAEILKQAKPHKYHARKKVVDGITFDSSKEAKRYCELRLLEKAGVIHDLKLQYPYPLMVAGHPYERESIGKYFADFRYRKDPTGLLVIEDVKGYDVPLGRWKRRHAEAQYGITVTLIK